jgi:hypothetical protein
MFQITNYKSINKFDFFTNYPITDNKKNKKQVYKIIGIDLEDKNDENDISILNDESNILTTSTRNSSNQRK